MRQMDISIIIPVYNTSSLLTKCLDSIFCQHTDYTYEVILVDDGSTDDSVKLIKARKESNIRFYQQQNAGPAAARNRGLKEAKGRYVTFIDADDCWENTYIKETVGFLEQHEECVAVNVVCKNIAVSGNSYSPNCYHNENGIKNEMGEYTRNPFVLHDFYTYWAQYCHVGTCSTTIKAEIAKNVLMREDLRVSEDYEFWLLIASYGKWGIIPKPLYRSDGTDVLVNEEAWLSKMKRRWENAPAIDVWEKRIIERMPELKSNMSYMYAIGRISRNLTYCQLLSGRVALARCEALKYGKAFPKDRIGRLMNIMKGTAWSWWILCKFLKYREYHRF